MSLDREPVTLAEAERYARAACHSGLHRTPPQVLRLIMAEYDRRGAALERLLTACVANERHIRDHVPHLPSDGGSFSVHVIQKIVAGRPPADNPLTPRQLESIMNNEHAGNPRGRTAAPAAAGGGDGHRQAWIPPLTDCMDHAHEPACPHCGSRVWHERTRRCGDCGRRPVEVDENSP